MTTLMVAPDALTMAAGDIAGISSTIAEANSAAAVSTLGVLPPAADSVSAQLAELFGGHAQSYQSVSTRAEWFHQEFLNTMSTSAARYAHAETESAAGLGKGQTAGGLRVLGSRQHPAAGTTRRLWQPDSAAARLWRPGMADPRLVTAWGLNGDRARLWRPGTPSGLLSHPPLVPHNGLQGGMINDNPKPLQQIIQNQISYLKMIATSLEHFVTDELHAIAALPAAFEQAVKDLLHGNIKGAMTEINKALLHFFVTDGYIYHGHGYNPYGLPDDWSKYTFTGPMADLWQLMQIPAQEMQNLANLLGTGVAGKLAQYFANKIGALANGWALYTLIIASQPGEMGALQMGKGLALTFDLLGAPILSMRALEDSLQAVADNVMAGNPLRAAFDLLATPANMMHAFLFGQGYIQGGGPYTQEQVHLGGVFAPLDYPFVENGAPSSAGWQKSLKGMQTGGIVPALVSQLPPWLQTPLDGLGAFIEQIINDLHHRPPPQFNA